MLSMTSAMKPAFWQRFNFMQMMRNTFVENIRCK